MGKSRKRRDRDRSPVEKPVIDHEQVSYLRYLGGAQVQENLRAPAEKPDFEIRVSEYVFAIHKDKLVSESSYFALISKWQFQVCMV
jgi:hypothetical protein